MKDGKFESVEELRAWLNRKPPPREQDLEVANRPPEEWPPLESDSKTGSAPDAPVADPQLEAGHG